MKSIVGLILAFHIFTLGCSATGMYGKQQWQQPDYQAWQNIKPGMTEDEVVSVLGQPIEKQLNHAEYAQSFERDLRQRISESEICESKQDELIAKIIRKSIQVGADNFTYSWTYGKISYDSLRARQVYLFNVYFINGKVDEVWDPFSGEFSVDGVPTTPRLIYPAKDESFSHYPRVMDFRWQPSSGKYPMQYEIEVEWGQNMVIVGSEEKQERVDWYLEERTRTEVPHWHLSWVGANEGRWRVKAINHLGESEWSEYRHFKSSR